MEDEVVTALVQALVENPDDVATRSVLADGLLERDDPRGKLIQLDLALRRAGGVDPDRHLRKQIENLERTHGRQLAGDIAEHVYRYEIAGGFVDQIQTTIAVFKQHGERWFRAQPLRSFAPKPFNAAVIKALAKCPHVALVRTLRFERAGPNNVAFVPLEPLTRANLARLESFEFTWMVLAGEDAETFFRDLRAPRLHTIKFSSGFIGGAALRGLAANRTLCSQLKHLVIAHTHDYTSLEPDANEIASEALAALALPNLETLDVGYTWFSTPTRIATLLANTPVLESFQSDQVDDALLEALATCKRLRKLTGIYEPLSTDAYACLAAFPALEEISVITLPSVWNAEQIDTVVDALVALPATHPLRKIHMMNPPARLTERFS